MGCGCPAIRRRPVAKSPPRSRSPKPIPTSSPPSSSATRCCCAAKCRQPTSSPPSARSRPRCRCPSPMRTSGSSGCAIPTCRTRSISSPSTSCPIGRISRSRPRAAAHVAAIRSKVAAAFPNKEIVIGEFGWPSAGRMREGARPSPSNQARAIEETLALARRENFRVNIIEAFDQPWKRWLEGAVGGYWGIFDRATGAPKFNLAGGGVSDHPDWRVQALAGILLGRADVRRRVRGRAQKQALRGCCGRGSPRSRFFPPFCSAGRSRRCRSRASASAAGCVRSLSRPSRRRRRSFAPRPAPPAGRCRPSPRCLGARQRAPRLHSTGRSAARLSRSMLFSVQAALGLVFDPRYRDIPFAPFSAASCRSWCCCSRRRGRRARAPWRRAWPPLCSRAIGSLHRAQ